MINHITRFVDENLQVVRASITFTGAVGLYIFIKRSHLIKVYHNVKEIPTDFITKKIGLRGTVEHITPDGRLQVKHHSILFKRFTSRVKD